MRIIHGGDVYRNRVDIDFSTNTNLLGMPREAEEALHEAARSCGAYPDPGAEALRYSLAHALNVPEEYLIFGNGSSELFPAVVRALRPRAVLIPAPSFSGYEYAANSFGAEILFHELREENGFLPDDELIKAASGADLIFLANPNNPTGRLMARGYLRRLLDACGERGATLVLDESYIGFCGMRQSMVPELSAYPNLLIVRSFTKIFAMPGVRLGYLLCGAGSVRDRIKRQLPEWNISSPAQAAGLACVVQAGNVRDAYLKETLEMTRREICYLSERMGRMGLRVFPSEANYILFFSGALLYEELLERGILIRDCASFRGLSSGYYRVAARRRDENERLLAAIEEILDKGRRGGAYVPGNPGNGLGQDDVGPGHDDDGLGCDDAESCRDGAGPGRSDDACGEAPEDAFVRALPEDIEADSFRIIGEELKARGIVLPAGQERVTKRVIHATADFDYAETLRFSENAAQILMDLIAGGADIVTDTNMALAGINKARLKKFGGEAHCFMAEDRTAAMAKRLGTTRAAVSMRFASEIEKPVIFAIGNAPTALMQIYEMARLGRYRPAFVIGVPVGFVNVEAAKEMITRAGVPYIVNTGRKGGSSVAAAICNAALYGLGGK